jgi:hypothetical protein
MTSRIAENRTSVNLRCIIIRIVPEQSKMSSIYQEGVILILGLYYIGAETEPGGNPVDISLV